jgi:hypothetical protein
VGDRCGGPGLAHEALSSLFIVGDRCGKQLERDRAAEVLVARLVDTSHASLTQKAGDPIAPDRSADQRRVDRVVDETIRPTSHLAHELANERVGARPRRLSRARLFVLLPQGTDLIMGRCSLSPTAVRQRPPQWPHGESSTHSSDSNRISCHASILPSGETIGALNQRLFDDITTRA